MEMNKKTKTGIIIGVIVLLLIIIGFTTVQSTYNNVIQREEDISATKSNIDTEIKTKNLKFQDLINAVNSYNKYETTALKEVVEARKTNNSTEQEKALNILVEKYPELQSIKNYNVLMTEFRLANNQVKQQQNVYNRKVRDYNSYTRNFYTSFTMKFKNYKIKKYDYLKFDDNLTKENNDISNQLK